MNIENIAVQNETKAQNIVNAVVTKKAQIDKFGRAYGTGRRKVSVARVWIKPGLGKLVVNGQDAKEYFKRDVLVIQATIPLVVTNTVEKFDIYSTVCGGGIVGQVGALRHGLSRALDNYEPILHHVALKKAGLLTRDSRMVESKKAGRKKARKSFQFVKR